MIPPTSIDGTDITGATIDGTDVQEITVDGDVVFSATNLPTAYSNLIAWYPFDSGIYGGSNTSDVTAIFESAESGDSTAYDLTLNGTGLTHETDEGVRDFDGTNPTDAYENTADSGSYFSGLPTISNPFSFSFWYYDFGSGDSPGVFGNYVADPNDLYYYSSGIGTKYSLTTEAASSIQGTAKTNQWVHAVVTNDGSTLELFHNKNSEGTTTAMTPGNPFHIAGIGPSGTNQNMPGYIDDFRIYDKVLSQSEIDQIYDNTNP